MNRLRRKNIKRNQHKFNFDSLAVPMAFINGLFFGGLALRKIRQYWEGGPTD